MEPEIHLRKPIVVKVKSGGKWATGTAGGAATIAWIAEAVFNLEMPMPIAVFLGGLASSGMGFLAGYLKKE